MTTIRKWADKLKQNWWPLLEALSGADDPYGDDLRRLERRIRQLEADVGTLRSPSKPVSARAAHGE